MWKVLGAVLVLAIVAVGVTFYKGTPPKSTTQSETSPSESEIPRVEIIAKNLEVPWALTFLPASPASQRGEPAGGPNGQILVTERIGRVSIIDNSGKSAPKTLITLSQVKQSGESGLHGIAIHPKYPANPYVYLYYTYSSDKDNSLNRVSRFNFDGQILKGEKVIIDKIPGAIFHDGGRIKFGPDGYLYITTGDAQNPSLAQDKNSLAGKILRVTDSGKPAPGNPLNNEVYSYGHRNPQGITWGNLGRLWSTEHGASATDEINLIEAGKNYGWPEISGDQKQQGMASPILQSGKDTWAPAGAAFFNDSIYFAGLRGQALFEYNLETKQLTEHLKGQFGRIREVVLGPGNMVYITTSNRDGRGNPSPDDDRIIRVNPSEL